MKKKLAVLLSATMILSMSAPAFAYSVNVERGVENYPVKIVYMSEDEAIKIAQENNILVGISESDLYLNGDVTAQDMAVMLWNNAGRPTANGKLAQNAFDADLYGKVAFKWAVAKGLFSETSDPLTVLTADDIMRVLGALALDTDAVLEMPKNPSRKDAVKAIVEALGIAPEVRYEKDKRPEKVKTNVKDINFGTSRRSGIIL